MDISMDIMRTANMAWHIRQAISPVNIMSRRLTIIITICPNTRLIMDTPGMSRVSTILLGSMMSVTPITLFNIKIIAQTNRLMAQLITVKSTMQRMLSPSTLSMKRLLLIATTQMSMWCNMLLRTLMLMSTILACRSLSRIALKQSSRAPCLPRTA